MELPDELLERADSNYEYFRVKTGASYEVPFRPLSERGDDDRDDDTPYNTQESGLYSIIVSDF